MASPVYRDKVVLSKSGVRIFDCFTIGKYGQEVSVKGNIIEYILGIYRADVEMDGQGSYIVSVYHEGVLLHRWCDSWIDSSRWARTFIDTGYKVFYIGDAYSHMEIEYKTSVWTPVAEDVEYDCRIGTLDIETFSLPDGGHKGLSLPYACGFRDHRGSHHLFYLNRGEDYIELIIRMIKSLVVRANDRCKFYVHNLSGFDGRFILDALGRMPGYRVHPLGRGMTEIFQIKISTIVGKRTVSITLLDSVYLLPASLYKLSMTFKASDSYEKGVLPHDFVNSDNLYYEGNIPDYKFYSQWLSLDDYNQIAALYDDSNPWSLKKECLSYLKKDLDSLYYVMNTFNRSVFERFLVNPTTVSSYSALSKKVYLTAYYPKVKQLIPVISGYIEGEIRKGYYGGIVDVVQHIVTDAYKYDSNSHYPAAMLNDMPVGNPRLSDLKDLNQIFGFCYAKITAPRVEDLKVAILPAEDDDGNIHCPRGVFYGRYFSEELKDVINYGYKVEVRSSILFDRGKDLFKEYITDLFKMKADAKEIGDTVHELIYKLLQNSMYGKTGQREIDYNFKWIPVNMLHLYEKKHHIDLTQRFGDMVLVRDHGKIDSELSSFIKDPASVDIDSDGASIKYDGNIAVPPRQKGGVKSSVSIAAAITAYARINMNRFKNIPGNNYLGGGGWYR